MEYVWSRGMSQGRTKSNSISVYPPQKIKADNRIEELNKVCGDAYKAHYELVSFRPLRGLPQS
jgi:hypothetical protein